MKKCALILIVGLLFLLTSCDFVFSDEPTGYTDSQLRTMIDEVLDEREAQNTLYLSEDQLSDLIASLLPSYLSEDEIIDFITQYVPTDLTQAEIITLIENVTPAARVEYDLAGFEEVAVAMIQNRSDSVIGIQNNRSDGSSWGSGVIYKKSGNTYYVVTNHHVIENYQSLEVMYDRLGILTSIKNDKITVLGSDPVTDLAVLTFTSEVFFPAVIFGDSYDLNRGQFVFAIGNPLGFQYYGTVTMGVLSGTARFIESEGFNATVLQHDAALSPGNSGGGLFNINGELIGINHMKILETVATNISFAVPVNTVKRVVADLEQYGQVIRPFLGISASVYVNVCGHDYGVCVNEVVPSTAAALAGIIVGDVITGFKHHGDDDFIDINNFNDLREAILNSRVDDNIIIRYIRNNETFTTNAVALGVHPDD